MVNQLIMKFVPFSISHKQTKGTSISTLIIEAFVAKRPIRNNKKLSSMLSNINLFCQTDIFFPQHNFLIKNNQIML